MIIKFRIISPDNEDFVRDIEILGNSNFLELHNAIQKACDYDNSMMSSFFVSNDNWERGQEIASEILDEAEQKDVKEMNNTIIETMPIEKGQKYLYLFDYFSVRYLFMEIVNVRKPEKQDSELLFPICTLSEGKAPKQFFIDDINPDLDDINLDDIDPDDDGNFDVFDDDDYFS